jgi:hypothetical protein
MKHAFPLVLLAGLLGCGSREPAAGPAPKEQPPARITQFYATAPALPRGESTNICYGVEGASAVTIDPPVEQLKPTLSRCISVSPTETTTYTLTAANEQGKTSSQSTTVTVVGSRPKFDDISISSKEVAPGQQVQFCFKAKNALSVRGGPGRFLSGGKPQGDCLIDNPKKTTSYQLTIVGAGGLVDEAAITVEVK